MATPKALFSGPLPAVGVPGSPWVTRTLPVAANWTAVAYGGGMFVAVNSNGTAASSPDGITWTARTMPSSSTWQAVTYGGGQFVAVGASIATCATSPDGITWTARTLPSSGNWRTVCYGAGMHVALTQGSTVAASSPDGITWTARTLPSASTWYSCCYGRGTFVAVCGAGTSSTTCAVSPDGINWNAVTLPVSADYRAVVFGGDTGFIAAATSTSNTVTSADGYNWTLRASPSQWNAFTAGEDAYLGIGLSTYAGYSPDGFSYQASSATAVPNATWTGAAYGNGTYVAVATGPSSTAVSCTNPANVLYRAPGRTVITSITIGGPAGSQSFLRIGKVPLFSNLATGIYTAFDVYQVLSAGTSISGYITTGYGVTAYIAGYET